VNLDITGIRYPDHPARSESLYLLSYPVSADFFMIPQRKRYETLKPLLLKFQVFWVILDVSNEPNASHSWVMRLAIMNSSVKPT
jgi:hypothetical protein